MSNPPGKDVDWLAAQALARPDSLAVRYGAETYTYSELDSQVQRACISLSDHAVRAGHVVAVAADSHMGFVITFHALMRLRATIVPLSRRLTPGEIIKQSTGIHLNYVVADPNDAMMSALLHDAAAEVTAVEGLALFPAESSTAPDTRPGADPPVAIIFTSGTTAPPKPVYLSKRAFWWSAFASAMNLGASPTDNWLCCVPFNHVSGLSILTRSVLYGCSVTVHARFDPDAVNRSLDVDGITHMSLVTPMLRRLLEVRQQGSWPNTLVCVLLGGGPLPPALIRQALDSGIPIAPTYGLTETCSQVATLPPHDTTDHVGSVGRALFGSTITVDASGEILVKGPTLADGVVGDDGWFHTGDIGHMDSEGYLTMLDRRQDRIVVGGENVSPVEIEAVLAGHASVTDAAVLAVPDDAWGHKITALVIAKGPVNAAELEAYCRKQLAAFKVPKHFVMVDEIPRSQSGKILRRELPQLLRLRDRAAGEMPRRLNR